MRRNLPFLALPAVNPGSRDFLWSTGIEDTFISAPDSRTGRTLDEYELTQHYDRWREDLDLIASLGVSCARYGVPWYRIEREQDKFDWDWTDRVLDYLVNGCRIEPIVDLVHYGTPAWLSGSFLNPSYPERVAAYARAFAERYRGLCRWYTPLNEPRVNAWYAARLGWWPPYGRSWRSFAAVLVALSKGIVLTQRSIAEVEPDAVFMHVDATDLYLPDDPREDEAAALRQELVFAALDLVQGQLTPSMAMYAWLMKQGIARADIDWFHENVARPHAVGYNMYPMFSEKHVLRNEQGRLRIQIRRCGAGTFERLSRMYAERYGIPIICTETADRGSPATRARWIAESTASVDRLRAERVPLIGYTYWPLFSLFGWAYQRGSRPLDDYRIDMGLWDLRRAADGETLERVPTSAVDAYQSAVRNPVAAIG